MDYSGCMDKLGIQIVVFHLQPMAFLVVGCINSAELLSK
jgi:hypothetical protein